MIKFSVNYMNGVLTVNEEGVKMFHDNVMTSDQVANILADGNTYSARELKIRLNSGADFAIAIPEERFNKLNYGYGLCDGHNAKIVMYYNLMYHLCFLTYTNGHVTTVCIQDGDVFSETPLKEETVKVSEMNSKEYRSKLFSLANQIRKETKCTQKEAFQKAKEQMAAANAHEPAPKPESAPQTKELPKYNKAEDNDETASFEEATEFIKNFFDNMFGGSSEAVKSSKPTMEERRETDSTDFLVAQFKKLVNIINELNNIEGELNTFFNKRQREKRIDPTPESMDPANVLLKILTDLFGNKKR